MGIFGRSSPQLIARDEALPGRNDYLYSVPKENEVLGTEMHPPLPEGVEVLYLGMGCFWGAEKIFWQQPGVYSTAVGYQGGFTPYPSYEEVCTGMTGHTESVMVAYKPEEVSTFEIIKLFWENHDPTQGFQQGNDIGTQYRSSAYWTNEDQRAIVMATRDSYAQVLDSKGFDPISTEFGSADDLPFYYAEAHHQQYLHKVPHGYNCHASTGIKLPT